MCVCAEGPCSDANIFFFDAKIFDCPNIDDPLHPIPLFKKKKLVAPEPWVS